MPWSGGVYSRGYPSWTNDANSGLAISATKFDTEDNDFATGLNNCATIDGLNQMQASFLPKTTITYDLGSLSKLWRNIYGQYFQATSTGIQGFGATASALVDMTPDTGTFTVTLTGCTTAPTGTATWARVGKLVTLVLPAISATSNANTFTLTGLPSEIQPTATTQYTQIPHALNNSTLQTNTSVQVSAGSGTITFDTLPNGGGWITSGTKGLNTSVVFSYLIA